MCSVHRLLLNCILFFHLAPQLTLWSRLGARHDCHSELDRIALRTTAGDRQFNHLPANPFIDRKTTKFRSASHYGDDLNHSPGRPANHKDGHSKFEHSTQNLAHKSKQSAHRSPKAPNPSNSPSNASSLIVNFASDRSSSSPADPSSAFNVSKVSNLKNYLDNHLDNSLDDHLNNYLNQKPPCTFNQKTSDFLSHASSSIVARAPSISSVIHRSNRKPDSPDPTVLIQSYRTIDSLLKLPIQFSAFSILSVLFVHLNEKPNQLWINRPVGAYAVSSDMRAHRKFLFFLFIFLFILFVQNPI